MAKFHGEFEQLKSAVSSTKKAGSWEAGKNDSQCFRAKSGEVVTWWPGKGTLLFQGTNQDQFRYEVTAALEGAEFVPAIPASALPDAQAKQIFLVHGHDREARDQLELILRRLGLAPFILQNSDGGTKTIIEALEQSIYKDATFGIILMTPDDFGYSQQGTEADRKPRARQNVILEMGMVMASLGRGKMAILQKGNLERPSDTDGILRIEFNVHVREIVPQLVQRLQKCGFDIPASKIAEASA